MGPDPYPCFGPVWTFLHGNILSIWSLHQSRSRSHSPAVGIYHKFNDCHPAQLIRRLQTFFSSTADFLDPLPHTYPIMTVELWCNCLKIRQKIKSIDNFLLNPVVQKPWALLVEATLPYKETVDIMHWLHFKQLEEMHFEVSNHPSIWQDHFFRNIISCLKSNGVHWVCFNNLWKL